VTGRGRRRAARDLLCARPFLSRCFLFLHANCWLDGVVVIVNAGGVLGLVVFKFFGDGVGDGGAGDFEKLLVLVEAHAAKQLSSAFGDGSRRCHADVVVGFSGEVGGEV